MVHKLSFCQTSQNWYPKAPLLLPKKEKPIDEFVYKPDLTEHLSLTHDQIITNLSKKEQESLKTKPPIQESNTSHMGI